MIPKGVKGPRRRSWTLLRRFLDHLGITKKELHLNLGIGFYSGVSRRPLLGIP